MIPMENLPSGHSSAHLFAEAMEAGTKGVKFGIGPPIENGFYYDIDTGDVSITLADLPKIEKRKWRNLANLKKANTNVRIFPKLML